MPTPSPLLIGPGDLLVISVYGENGRSLENANQNELPTDYQVDSDGVITFPSSATSRSRA